MIKRKPPTSPDEASRHAKQTAGVVLEVLAGMLTPSEAATTLGISTSRYYMIESKALEGLVAACEAGRKNSQRRPEKRIEALEKDKVRLERECARYQALVRASQRTVGLAVKKAKKKDDKRGRRKRRKPSSRALRYAGKLKEQIKGEERTDEQGKTAGGTEPGRGSGRFGTGKEETADNTGDDNGK